MIHPDLAGVKKSQVRAEIAKKFKAAETNIAVFGLKAKFGGGRSSCFVTIYDSEDAREKYDSKSNRVRVSFTSGLSNAFGWLRPALSGPSAAADCLMARLFSLNFAKFLTIYFNRTASLLSPPRPSASSPKSSRARERESRVPPSPRSRPARRRSEQPLPFA